MMVYVRNHMERLTKPTVLKYLYDNNVKALKRISSVCFILIIDSCYSVQMHTIDALYEVIASFQYFYRSTGNVEAVCILVVYGLQYSCSGRSIG